MSFEEFLEKFKNNRTQFHEEVEAYLYWRLTNCLSTNEFETVKSAIKFFKELKQEQK